MEIKPIGARVLVKPIEVEEKTAGGIYIPDSAKEKTSQGTVVEIGDDKDIKVEQGDKVIYESYAGTEVTLKGGKHLIIDNKDIIAIVR